MGRKSKIKDCSFEQKIASTCHVPSSTEMVTPARVA